MHWLRYPGLVILFWCMVSSLCASVVCLYDVVSIVAVNWWQPIFDTSNFDQNALVQCRKKSAATWACYQYIWTSSLEITRLNSKKCSPGIPYPDKTQRLGSFEQTSFVPFYGMCNVRPSWRTIVLIYALVYLTLHAALMQLLTEKNLITIKYIMNVSIY